MSADSFTFSTSSSTRSENIPPELMELDIWVVEDGKQPCYPSWEWHGDDGPITTTFEEAMTELRRREDTPRPGDGLGIILESSVNLVVIDGDNVVRESGEIHPDFRDILHAAGTYSEYSTSGTGIHTYVFGADGLESNKAMKYDDFEELWACGEVPHIDLFGSQEARNIVITGDAVTDNRTIRESPQFVRELHQQFPNRETTTPSETVQQSIDGDVLDFETHECYTCADVRATIETYTEYGSGEAQARAEKVLTLWDSNPSPNPRDGPTRSETVGGVRYNSPSEADWDFLTGLAYYCRGDKALIRDCWKSSNRWTRPDKEKSPTYYHRTIENAVDASTTRISRQNVTEVTA